MTWASKLSEHRERQALEKAARIARAEKKLDAAKPAEAELAPILTSPRSAYIKQMAKAAGIKKGSPGYDDAMGRIEADYDCVQPSGSKWSRQS